MMMVTVYSKQKRGYLLQ